MSSSAKSLLRSLRASAIRASGKKSRFPRMTASVLGILMQPFLSDLFEVAKIVNIPSGHEITRNDLPLRFSGRTMFQEIICLIHGSLRYEDGGLQRGCTQIGAPNRGDGIRRSIKSCNDQIADAGGLDGC